jgi:hypothetical protein
MRRKPAFVLTAVLLLFAAPAVMAQGKAPAFELTPTAGYWYGDTLSEGTTGIFDFDVTIDDAPSYGLRLAYRFSPALALEMFYAESTADMVTGEDELFGGEQSIGEIDLTVAEVGIEGSFGTSRVVPFIAGGIGAMRLDPRLSGASADTRFAGNFGGGLKLFLAPQLALRFDARLHSVLIGENEERDCDDWDDWEEWDCQYNDWLNFVEVAVGLSIVF